MSRSRRSSPTHRSVFRPCIDLHDGHVKQIVGGTLSNNPEELRTNFVATDSAASFARLYRMNQLEGGHVVKLGPGNDSAAKEALAAWRGMDVGIGCGLQIGGGITEANAQEWLDAGASKVNFTPFRADRTLILSPPVQQIIVTSYLFPNARFSLPRLQSLCRLVGRERLVVDVRKSGDKWVVAMNKWQDLTDMEVNKDPALTPHTIPGLGEWSTIPVTYAGGARGEAIFHWYFALVDRGCLQTYQI
ncbi:N-(5'-phospho-D-ribosylformimino)-5 [Rhizoctonia solani AG-1 IA]|uniref:N-(5'-phospho-D-ribosylformimino)-5 n=1 Tax=Thanatephorus cucumeris (strain AG1-IA) TaxID=983506 RepID=L8X8Y6_THACA|nr:N-(5'-phospho-D-ribosylformimino)-5 [Rhizoctonia solani AG-1 IA]